MGKYGSRDDVILKLSRVSEFGLLGSVSIGGSIGLGDNVWFAKNE